MLLEITNQRKGDNQLLSALKRHPYSHWVMELLVYFDETENNTTHTIHTQYTTLHTQYPHNTPHYTHTHTHTPSIHTRYA